MKKAAVAIVMALAVSTFTAFAQDAGGPPPSGGSGPDGAQQRQGPPGGGFHLLPPHAMEQLKLTADQQKQVADLETEVKAKIEKILTPEQLQQLKQMRPPQRQGGQGGGGPGAGGQGGPGGGGGQGQPNRQRPASE